MSVGSINTLDILLLSPPFELGTSPPPPPPPATPGTVAGRWVVPNVQAQSLIAGFLYKTSPDRRWFVFDYGNLPQIIAGYTLDNPTIAAVTSPLSVTLPVVVDATVGTWVSGGTANVEYEITVTVDIMAPAMAYAGTVEVTGLMKVVDY
jgi:hypothetical protein